MKKAPYTVAEASSFFNENLQFIWQRGQSRIHKLKRIFLAALFGSIIFVVNVFLPPPINYMFIVLQAVLLALSGLFIKKIGATSAGAVGGLLSALGSPGLGIFTFIASVLFGALVDACLIIFRVNGSYKGVNRNRLILAIAVATLLIGVITYSGSVIIPEQLFAQAGLANLTLFIHRSLMLDAMVLFMGPVTGAVAGYAAAYLWNKYLKNIAVAI